MLLDWEWLSPAVWMTFIAAIVLLLIVGTGRSKGRGSLGEFHVRHEVIDECFAKGEMTREECETGCASRGDCHAPAVATAAHADDLSPPAKEERRWLRSIKRRPISAWTLLGVGLILVIEPLLPWYHFSVFWFSLGLASTMVALRDVLRRR